MFWPAAMIVILAASVLSWPAVAAVSGRRLLLRGLVAPLVATLFTVGWIGRNYVVFEEPLYSFASAGGPANVAAIALADLFHREVNDIRFAWLEDFHRETGHRELTWIEHYRLLRRNAGAVMQRYPAACLRAYGRMVWENLTATNQLFRAQLPKYKWTIAGWLDWYENRHLNQIVVWMSLAGAGILLWQRRWRAVLILTLIFAYCAATIGVTQWQGSRLFYPGQIAWAILIAVVFDRMMASVRHGWGVLGRRFRR
jgi:hypothetical protein